MRMYDVLSEFKKLTPIQKDYAVQWFCGQYGMMIDGFTDSESRPQYAEAVNVANTLEDSVRRAASYAQSGDNNKVDGGAGPGVVSFSSGVQSTDVPPFHLIPTVALVEIANRFKLGVERKGDKAWNAISSNQECLADDKFIIDRVGHAMLHLMRLRDALISGVVDEIVDDAAAVAWSGVFFICAASMVTRVGRKE